MDWRTVDQYFSCALYFALQGRKNKRSRIFEILQYFTIFILFSTSSKNTKFKGQNNVINQIVKIKGTTIALQCFDTVGWVIWPVKIVPDMTYNVFWWDVKPYSMLYPDKWRVLQ